MVNVKELHFKYNKTFEETIKGINFSIKKGEIFGFLGPSGAGKSTIQKILIGILKNYQGSVIVNGYELKDVKGDFFEKIGVAFEFPNFYHKFSGIENLWFFAKMYTNNFRHPQDLLKSVGLAADANVLYQRYSKGMKMRLNFCRALLNDPDVLFLDEPTSGLDPLNAKNLRNLILAEKSRGKTIIITTHDMHTAEQLCDRVAFIVDGKIELIDSPNNLKLKHGSAVVKVRYRETADKFNTKEFPLLHLGENPEFLQLLKKYQVITMHTQEATLEDIFIETTGRGLI